MNIAFMITWPDKMGKLAGSPTFFPEKVLSSLVAFYPQHDWESFADEIDKNEQPYECTIGNFRVKPHTIRQNKSKRYKEGVLLQPFIWWGKAYRSKQFYFSPKFPCTGTQSIEIIKNTGVVKCYSDSNYDGEMLVRVDGRLLGHGEINRLAINDGFDSIQSFFRYFDSDFKGDIIHWTDLRY